MPSSSADGGARELWHPGKGESGQASRGRVNVQPGKQAFILTCPFLRVLQQDGVTARVLRPGWVLGGAHGSEEGEGASVYTRTHARTHD